MTLQANKTVKSLYIEHHSNLENDTKLYGIVFRFGRSKFDKVRHPYLFKDIKIADEFYESIRKKSIGKTQTELSGDFLKEENSKYAPLAINVKLKKNN